MQTRSIVIIPTYNEKENIENIIRAVTALEEGFNVLVIDGHNFEEIFAAFDAARACKGKPTAIIAKTHKGHGVSFMEDQAGWHGKAPNEEQARQAVEELGGEW